MPYFAEIQIYAKNGIFELVDMEQIRPHHMPVDPH